MKKLIILIAATVMLAGCGVGSYSVTSGKADQAELSVAAASEDPITITVDDKENYQVFTVKTKVWKKDRKIKKTAKNTVTVTPGKHAIKITSSSEFEKDTVLYNRNIYVGTGEHKVIEL